MQFILLAQTDPNNDGPSGITIFIGIVVLLLIHWWLYSRGFYGRFFRACMKSATAMIVGAIVIGALSMFSGASTELSNTLSSNGALVFLGIAFLGTTIYFYRKSPRLVSDAAEMRDDYAKEETHAKTEKPVPAAAGYCRHCRGVGETTDTCTSCGGVGETRCTYQEMSEPWFFGEKYVSVWCSGGVLTYECGFVPYPPRTCYSCNGRGFLRCYACGASGKMKVKCKRCNGTG